MILSSRTLRRILALAVLSLAPALAVASDARPPENMKAPDFGSPTERWDALSLAGSQLTAIPPLPMERDTYPEFTREMIALQWRDNDPIYVFVITPPVVKRAPVILYLYNYTENNERFSDFNFCKLLVKQGFAAVGFSSALAGHRYHNRPMKQWFVSELEESLATTTHDVLMVLDYLATRKDIDSRRIGIFGQGSGGAIAVLAASVAPQIRAVHLLDPWGDWPDWFKESTVIPAGERDGFLTPEFQARAAPFDPLQVLPKLKQPLRYQYLTKPADVPQDSRARLEAALPKRATFIPEQEGLAQYKASGGDDFFDWIKEQLHAPKSAGPVKKHE